MMQRITDAVCAWTCTAYFGVKNFIANEVTHIKEDESGMEMIQVILIILMVVIIAAALWAFLGDRISQWLNDILQNTDTIKDPGMNPLG